MVIYKPGVSGTPSTQISYAISVAERIYAGLGYDLVVTSLRDGQHSASSLHYSGNAVDLRTNTLNASQRQSVYQAIRAELYSRGYDVILESDHLHIEYDPKGSRLFNSANSLAPLPQFTSQPGQINPLVMGVVALVLVIVLTR
jgi:hypothetical protein